LAFGAVGWLGYRTFKNYNVMPEHDRGLLTVFIGIPLTLRYRLLRQLLLLFLFLLSLLLPPPPPTSYLLPPPSSSASSSL